MGTGMNLADITPLVLTFNEADNIRRTLDGLMWASRIVVVDSFSNDETLAIVAEYPQAEVFQRAFDHFADQCQFGLSQIKTRWTLSLDADYVCSKEFTAELSALAGEAAGYQAKFRYCVNGFPLRATLYPPRTVLYRTAVAKYRRDGHAHRVAIDGGVGSLRTPIDHDDRKPNAVWLAAQTRYAMLEADKLMAADGRHGWKDWLRKRTFLAPSLAMFYCLFWKALILDGRPGILYSLQRAYAELLLLLTLLDRELRSECPQDKSVRLICK